MTAIKSRRHLLALSVRVALAVLSTTAVSGCIDDIKITTVSLDEAQARSEFRDLGIGIPDTYSFRSTRRTPPSGPEAPIYDAVFDSPSPPVPVLLDGAELPMAPTSCREMKMHDMRDGLNCGLLSNLRAGSARLTSEPYGLRVVAGDLSSGDSRIYIRVVGD